MKREGVEWILDAGYWILDKYALENPEAWHFSADNGQADATIKPRRGDIILAKNEHDKGK